MRVLRTTSGRAVAAVALGLALFLITGWAAGRRTLVVDWSSFRQTDALVFLGAYGQLVLAAAVFFQIRLADRALARQTTADERQVKALRADALVLLVAKAANARSLYVAALPALRDVTYNHGRPEALARAEAELAPAEQLHQDAHAARFRVEVLHASDEGMITAARELTEALNRQRQRARGVLTWSRGPNDRPAPDPARVAEFREEAQKTLLAAAAELVAAPYASDGLGSSVDDPAVTGNNVGTGATETDGTRQGG